MSDQIILAWTVDVTNTPIGPAEANTRLAAVPLYTDTTTDPVLGQNFGLTVASDQTTNDATSATRTLTLNMTTGGGAPPAPPPFPCHPLTSTPPVLPYPLREAITLPGSFFVQPGATSIPVTETQIPSLSIGDSVQFLSQLGVFYGVASVGATSIGLSSPYTGEPGNTSAFKEITAPVTRAAIYSTSELDTAGVATVPAIAAGPGAQIVEIAYLDSLGNGPFSVAVSMTGKRPAAVTLDPMSIDIAVIVQMVIGAVGGFGNSVGEITLVELSEALPTLPTGLPLGTGIGPAQTPVGKVGAPIPRTFKTMTDEAQLLIDKSLVYLPPSFFALAAQMAAMPALAGDFIVTTGSADVPTTEDQTGVLSAGNIIEFVVQPGVQYTILQVTPKIVTLASVFIGIDTNNTPVLTAGTNSNAGTKGNLGDKLLKKTTGAKSTSVAAAPPSAALLAAPLGQFMEMQTAAPPPKPPLDPATVPTPTFKSGLFTQALQLALAGIPITSATITFA